MQDRVTEIERQIVAAYESKHTQRWSNGIAPSQVGNKCERALWYAFRWAYREHLDGRMLRLFQTGNREEGRVIADLEDAGYTVSRQQEEIQVGDWMHGYIDGVVHSYQMPKHLLEIKTHSQNSFDKLEAKGVESSKPLHYAQMQIYMHATQLHAGLYVAVNKNTDAYYIERIIYSAADAQALIERAERVALAIDAPAKISDSPEAFSCQYCPMLKLCHQGVVGREGQNLNRLEDAVLPEVNCRTCTHWGTSGICRLHNFETQRERQETGCSEHRMHPDLVPFTRLREFVYRDLNGKELTDVGGAFK